MPKRIPKKEKQSKAREQVESMYKEALACRDPASANELARKIRNAAMKVNLSLPSEIRRRICRKCGHFLLPGRNCRVRTTNHHIVSHCGDCGTISRFGYIREQKLKRKH